MSKDRLRFKEIKKLSAYLDDEMNLGRRQIFEAELERNSEMQSELERMRKTKAMVGMLPRLAAPRQYTLTPDMVTERVKTKHPFLAYARLATSLAAIMLLVLFSVDFISTNFPMYTSQRDSAMMVKSVYFVQGEESVPLIIWNPAKNGLGRQAIGMGEGDYAAMAAPAMIEVDTGAVFNEEIMPGDELSKELESLGEEAIAPEVETLDDYSDLSMLILGINNDEAGQVVNRCPDGFDDISSPQNRTAIIRALQMIFAFITIVGGLTWWLLTGG